MTTFISSNALQDDDGLHDAVPTTEPEGVRIGVVNNKGGVGKTVVVRELGSALARRGRRVLLVDMDPQGNLTRRTAVAHSFTDAGSIADILHTPTKGGARDAIVPCGWDIPEADRIHVLPADFELSQRDTEAARPGSHGRLARVLYGVTDDYDYTLIDCRPTLAHLEQMVVASLTNPGDGVIIPVEPGADAISGAYRVMEEIREWADDMDVTASVLGIVVNLYDGQLRLHSGRVRAMPASLSSDRHAAPPILEPYIPRRVRIAEVQDRAVPSTGDQRLQQEGILTIFNKLARTLEQISAQAAATNDEEEA